MLFIFPIAGICNPLRWIKIPIFLDPYSSRADSDKGGGRDRRNSNVWGSISSGIHCQPARYVGLVDGESLGGKQDQRIEYGAPRGLAILDCVIKRTNSHEVFRQDQMSLSLIPYRDCPIAKELRKTIRPPEIKTASYDFEVR